VNAEVRRAVDQRLESGLRTLRPRVPRHSGSFTGSSGALIDVSDAIREALKSRTMHAESRPSAIVDRAHGRLELLPGNALSLPSHFTSLCSSSVPCRPAGHLTNLP
jgi:hypothetical protein